MKNNKNTKIDFKMESVDEYSNKGLEDSISGFSNIFQFLLSRYLKSPFTYLIIIIPLILIFGIFFIMPADKVFPALISISVSTHVFLTYGTSFYTIRRSTMYKNIKLTQYGLRSQYSAAFLLTAVTTIVFFMITLLLAILLTMIPNFFAIEWPWGAGAAPSGEIAFVYGNWSQFLYYVGMLILLTIITAFFIQVITNTNKSYMSFVITYQILVVIFGSLVLFPFNALQEIDSAGNLIISELSPWDKDFVPTTGEYILVRKQGELDMNLNSFQFWMQLFIPHYGLNAFGYTSFTQFTSAEREYMTEGVKLINTVNTEWLYTVLLHPFYYITALPIISTIILKIKKKNGKGDSYG